ncbi:hypothetical protein CRUP_020036, partial [Coryphaenoides rupestris]
SQTSSASSPSSSAGPDPRTARESRPPDRQGVQTPRPPGSPDPQTTRESRPPHLQGVQTSTPPESMAISSLAALLILLQVLSAHAVVDTGSFVIYNKDHKKCVRAESPMSITVARCNPQDPEQKFRWVSSSRLLSVAHHLCVGATEINDFVKVLLFPCDEKSKLQQWECKNATLFGLVGQDLHFNWGNRNERNIVIYTGFGSWSRWIIYGTEGDLCSKGYQETFTLGGSASGAPCQFPFQFQDKWYSECTVEGRTDKQLWCSTQTKYETDQMWGFCPDKGTRNWDDDPVTGVKYQRNIQSRVTWHQARKSCQQQGADLLSIVELHEQSYIAGTSPPLSVYWNHWKICLETDSGWSWSDGNPFRYLNWAPGHPASSPGEDCGALNTARAARWESSECSHKRGYICRHGNSSNQIPPLAWKDSWFCPNHWVPYAGHCYNLQRAKTTWKDALSACHKEDADLASVHNIEEHSFLISQMGYLPTDQLWIGLNDQRSQMFFEWSDRSQVTFTRWQSDEPSHATNYQEDCVLIRGKPLILCQLLIGGERAVVLTSDSVQGWTRYRWYCYQIGAQTKTFDDAKNACEQPGGHLVDIHDRYESAYLVSLVGLRPEKYFWTGLSNMEDENSFRWSTGMQVAFTHFNIGMPDRTQGCVAMTTGERAGLWDVVACGRREKYVCKRRAEGVAATTSAPTPAPPQSCPDGWVAVVEERFCIKRWSYWGAGVKLFRKAQEEKKSWTEARSFCRALGGDLVSIHSHSTFNNIR